MSEVPLYLVSTIWRARALPLSKMDGCVPETQHVNLRIVGPPDRGRVTEPFLMSEAPL